MCTCARKKTLTVTFPCSSCASNKSLSRFTIVVFKQFFCFCFLRLLCCCCCLSIDFKFIAQALYEYQIKSANGVCVCFFSLLSIQLQCFAFGYCVYVIFWLVAPLELSTNANRKKNIIITFFRTEKKTSLRKNNNDFSGEREWTSQRASEQVIFIYSFWRFFLSLRYLFFSLRACNNKHTRGIPIHLICIRVKSFVEPLMICRWSRRRCRRCCRCLILIFIILQFFLISK